MSIQIITTYRSNSGRQTQTHTIYAADNHPQSYASSLQLHHQLLIQDVDYLAAQVLKSLNPRSTKTKPHRRPKTNLSRSYSQRLEWLAFRTVFLDKVTQQYGELFCEFCGQRHLDAETTDKDRLATIDHILPLSKGGDRYDEANLAVACYRCNMKKGNNEGVLPTVTFEMLVPIKYLERDSVEYSFKTITANLKENELVNS